MPADSTRKLLKEFGIAVTDFEDAAIRIREQAHAETARDVLMLAGEALAASAEASRRWLEVTRFLFEEQARLHAEVARRIAAAPGDRP